MSIGRNHMVTILEDDLLTLNPFAYVNDNIIDFWVLWITRHYTISESKVVTFASHFYDKLRDINGVEKDSHWTENRKIDISSSLLIIEKAATLHNVPDEVEATESMSNI